MKIIVIVQARMTSSRLPGKVLRPIGGRPMLQWVMESMAASQEADGILLATSDDPSDDPIEAFARENCWAFFRGSLDDVAQRYLSAAERVKADVIVRISGDSPLLPYELVDLAIRIFRGKEYDLVTNVKTRTYPKGASVEVFSIGILRSMILKLKSDEDREHVTPWLYRAEGVRLHDFQHNPRIGDKRLVVDTPEDFKVMDRVLTRLDRPHTDYELDEILAIRSQVIEELGVNYE